MNRFPLLSRFAFTLLLPLALLTIGGWIYLRSSLPPQDARVDVAGLSAPVDVRFDRSGVPHISAATDHDVFFAMGYLHARDRLWQMEVQRRFARGTLSEVMGEATLQQDVMMRTLDLPSAAATAWPALGGPAQRSLQAYADGVNAWLAAEPRLPPEFALLGVKPSRWTVIDSLAWQKVFSLQLSGNFSRELARYVASQSLTQTELATFFEVDEAVETEGMAVAMPSASVAGLSRLGVAMEQTLGTGGHFVGSNAWVVSGRYSGDGGATLANDPHLGLHLPSVWYAVVQKGDRLDTAGMSLVGLPLVVFGRNRDIAWGGTSMTADVQDLYFEQTDPAHPERYRFGEEWHQMQTRVETVQVKADFPAGLRPPRSPIKAVVRSSRHGPVISDVLGVKTQPIALRWTALDPGDTTYDSILQLNYAANWNEFRQALSLYVTPALNMLFADRHGNIGMQGVGRVPLRAVGKGAIPTAGWKPETEWMGFIDFDEMPREYNPSRGYIVSANNRNTGEDYPHFISDDWAPPGRAARIEQLIRTQIQTHGTFDVAASRAMQVDRTSLPARAILPRLLGVAYPQPRQREAVALLRDWNGEMSDDSQAATLFSAWMAHLRTELFSRRLQADWLQRGDAQNLDALVGGVSQEALNSLLTAQDSPWCGRTVTPGQRTCDEVLAASLDAAVKELEKLAGSDPEDWSWGRLHRAYYAHTPFSQIKTTRLLFERRGPGGGSADTIDVADSTFDPATGYRQTFGATFRQIIHFGSGQDSHLLINSSGQSGHPLSRHYADMNQQFSAGQYLSVRAGTPVSPASTITLVPVNAARPDRQSGL
ncbi:penicillin acylase family protein [Xanthomonas arboricola pv. corylina]|uniref:penicillin acylase family protein n=1 Tax=Xanthomonas arboricola TaxID=56448 RepID=UPI0015E2A1AF|nr:penicillin acylase family protein [Xanthomonas arboricola]MDN0205307.1 penicillin acylase family protein [Xanthomonas arboricola pv. corylina]MDN0218226.1 penicillin acylase family protein [Xanthomonas arboricola pv. corylina]MEB2125614.1 penicillin acylase family protein [Xanthomonas campestris pv. campestris]